MPIRFAHLHCHSRYSITDAMPSPKDYATFVNKYNDGCGKYEVCGLAITDHGVMSGIVSQYEAFNDGKVRPIYGCEVYHCMDVNNNPNKDRYHMVLLAMNETGLKNLYKISSHGGLNVIKGKTKVFPVTDIRYILSHAEGLVCLTACVAGFIPSLAIKGETDRALRCLEVMKKAFNGRVYIELQPHEFDDQLKANAELVKLANMTGLKTVMTCDSHYLRETDSQYHDILKDISHQKHFDSKAYLRSPEELEEYCKKYSLPLECLANTAEVMDLCSNCNPKPEDHRALLPVFPVPEGYTPDEYLREKTFEMLPIKLAANNVQDPERYYKQALYELDVICGAGFASYFLILWDWFEWCRSADILCGPGRGSAAGSIVSYALNITKVDPVKNGFFFERFLNKERMEFPDIDTDIPRDRRADAIKYLLGKYGKENVSQIVTFGKYKLKNTLKAILSSQGCPFPEQNAITKTIPDMVDGKEVTFDFIEKYIKAPENPDFSSLSANEKKELEKAWNTLQDTFKKYPIAYDGIKNVCGCYSNTGIHAGGVIICSKPINENGQIMMSSDKAVLPVLQFEMHDLDHFGFLKIDVLGLKTLDTIKMTMDLAGIGYDWYDSEDYSDASVYEMLRNGWTCDVFQMAKYSPTKMIADFNVTDIDGLCAVNAGNRPGPLEKDATTGKSMVDLYAEAIKTGVVQKWDPRIDHILDKTMGCIWYQETCMTLGRKMAGYSLGASDIRIRKVLGKKIVKKIPEIRNEFIYGKKSTFDEDGNVNGISKEDSQYCTGCVNNGFDESIATKVFDTMAAFAKYSFNRSHSFCYAVLGYKTAWLSKYYPTEFAIANCTINEKEEDIIQTLAAARKRKIQILPPDINKSVSGFSNDNGAIRYGFKAIKGIGNAALSFLESYRNQSGNTFSSFDDFHMKIHDNTDATISNLINDIRIVTGKNSVNPIKKDVEMALILSGCFDFAESNRIKLLNHYIMDIRREKPGSKIKLLDKEETMPLNAKRYNRKMKLALEKFFMGTYISEHPLDPFPYTDLEQSNDNEQVKIAGIVSNATMKKTKRNSDFLNIRMKAKDDIERTVNVFNETLSKSLYKDLKKNQIIVVQGVYSKQYNNINAKSVKIQIPKKQMLAMEEFTDNQVPDSQPEQPQMAVEHPGYADIWP